MCQNWGSFSTRFSSKTKSLTPQFFCVSDIGNSLSDCSQSMKKICVEKFFARTSLRGPNDEMVTAILVKSLRTFSEVDDIY